MNDELAFKVGDIWLSDTQQKYEIVYILEHEVVAKNEHGDATIFKKTGKAKYFGQSNLVWREPNIVKFERWTVVFKANNDEICIWNSLYETEDVANRIWKNNESLIKIEKTIIEVEI